MIINIDIIVTIILCDNEVIIVNTKLNLLYIKNIDNKVMMELVDMNSLGLFDFEILSVQVGFTLS